MSVTIDSLDIQINSSAGSAAANIDALAQSLGRLKSAAGMTKVVNNLNKLKDTLNSLAGANFESVKKVTQALSGLANIPKSEGLVSSANALKKLTKIASELDDATIAMFTQKMKQLSEALAPLATSIDRIGAGFARLPKNVRAAAKAVGSYENAVESADNAVGDFRGSLTDIMSHFDLFVDAVRTLATWIATAVSEAKELDGITSRFVRVFGEGSQAMYDRVTEFNEVLGINKQEFMQYSGIFGSFAMGFGIPTEKISEFSTALTQLSYDIYSAYNDIYPNFEDAATAVKSAITGELEPIRNAGISISEASLKIVAANHGITESVETMTQSQKTLLYYQALVDAANSQGIVGNYARELNTAEGAIRSFKEAIKTLVQSLGTMFLPMIQAVLPWVTAFVNILSDAAAAVARFFGYESPGLTAMADSAAGVADGMENATAAAKEFKGATMGFDELNVLSPNTGAAASGGGGNTGGDLAQIVPTDLWDTAMIENANNKVAEAEEKIRALIEKIEPAIPLIGAFFAAWALYGPVKEAAQAISYAKDMILAVKGALAGSQAAMSALSFMNGGLANIVATFKAGGISGLFSSLGSSIAGAASALGPVLLILAAVAAVAYVLYENWDLVVAGFKKFAENIGLSQTIEAIKDAVGRLLDKFGGFKEIVSFIGTAVLANLAPVGAVLAGVFDAIMWAIPPLLDTIGGLIDIIFGLATAIIRVFKGDFQGALESVKRIGQGIVDVFLGLVRTVVGLVVGFVEGIIGFFHSLWDTLVGHSIVPDTINAIVDWFASLPGKILGGLKKFCDSVVQKFKDLWSTVTQWWKSSVAPKFTLSYWANIFSVVKDGFVNAIKNAINGAITLMNKFIGWLNEKLNFSWDGLKIAGKTVFEGGSIQLFTIPSIPKLEKGGVLEDGLFTMNRGEIAGKFTNGKSVVANNEMIVEGISAGVYQAVVAAMNATKNDGEQAVNVYLDGKQIYASIKKTEAERGRSLMGRQLGYSY